MEKLEEASAGARGGTCVDNTQRCGSAPQGITGLKARHGALVVLSRKQFLLAREKNVKEEGAEAGMGLWGQHDFESGEHLSFIPSQKSKISMKLLWAVKKAYLLKKPTTPEKEKDKEKARPGTARSGDAAPNPLSTAKLEHKRSLRQQREGKR